MDKSQETYRLELIEKLKILYKQNIEFITKQRKGLDRKHYSQSTINLYEKLNAKLSDYIERLEEGLPIEISYEEWCTALGDTLLDDDNFYIEEDGFSWH